MAWEERMYIIQRNGKSKLKQKLLTPVTQDNSIKHNAVVVAAVIDRFISDSSGNFKASLLSFSLLAVCQFKEMIEDPLKDFFLIMINKRETLWFTF